jgi:hypothetical protein
MNLLGGRAFFGTSRFSSLITVYTTEGRKNIRMLVDPIENVHSSHTQTQRNSRLCCVE